jgi:serine/threonine protein kinase
MDESPSSVTTAKPAAGPENLSGTTLGGDFHLQRLLGQGGMGQVYLGEQISLKRKVAVKVVRPDLIASATSLKRFKAEAQAVARLSHPNIVQVYAFGEQDGTHYIALEFVEGKSLGSYMHKKGALPVDVSLAIIRQVASALQHASEHGIVHRDIKPENILITRKAEAKVTDFGLARSMDEETGQSVTQSGVIIGTPVYMSPEQVHGKKPDCRTDIYSLGITFYHMLAGRPPYRGDSAFDLAFQHVEGTPPKLRELRPDISPELEAVVMKMMAKKPEDRFQTGRDLLKALAQATNAATASVDSPVPVEFDFEPPGRQTVRAERLDRTEPHEVSLKRKSRLKKTENKPAKSNLGLWIGVAVAVMLMFVVLIGALVVGRAIKEKERAKKAEVANVAPNPEPERAPPPPVTQPPPPPPDKPPPFTKAELAEEDRLTRALPLFFSGDRAAFHKDIQAFFDLGNFYFDHKHYEDADRFFIGQRRKFEQRPRPPNAGRHPVVLLTEIGHATVLAYVGKAKESNEELLRLNGDLPQYAAMRHMVHYEDLRKWTKAALDLNAKAGPLPKQLVELRKELDTIKTRTPSAP